MSDAFFALDREWRFTYLNAAAERALGRPRAEVLGLPIWEALPALGKTALRIRLERALRDGNAATFTASWPPERRLYAIRAYPDSATKSIAVYFQELPARAPKESSESDERYRVLLDLVPGAVYICDASGIIQEHNQQAIELWGREPKRGDSLERFCGLFKLYHPDGRPMPHYACPMARALRGETLAERDAEIVIERPDGQRRHVIVYPQILRGARGEITGAINYLYDITERKRAEEASAYLAAIITSAEDAIASKTLDSIITSWNASAERMFGYTAKEMIGQSILRITPPDRLDEEDAIIARLRAGERIEHFETVRMAKDGRALEVSLTISPVRDSRGVIIGASNIARDITERKQIEAKLRESEEYFRTLADNIPQFAWMARPDGSTFWYNQRWYDYTGLTPEAQESWGQQSSIDPNILPHVNERWQHSISTGELFEMVLPLRGADGVFRPFLTRTVPVKDERGQVVRWFGTSTDVSDLRAAEDALRAANHRMDEFLHTATHELKTPLTALQATLQLAERRVQRLLTSEATGETAHPPRQEVETVAQLLSRTLHQIRRQTRLVNDLVDAARIQADKLELRLAPCDLAVIVREAVAEQRAVRPERIIQLQLAEDVRVPSEVDADRVGQVVINYLTNALKYSAADRPVEVTLRVEREAVRVAVRDEGPGIPAEEQEHIWGRGHRVPGIEPMSEGVGLGLGLHISRTIVERHGGQVGVESAPGQGSTFWFTLPLTSADQ